MIVVTILLALFLFLACGLVRTHLSARRLEELNWDDLIARVEPVRTNAIAAVAAGYLNPGSLKVELTPDALWKTIGGAEGLSRMRANSDVLIALATYAQRWNRVEGLVVAEQMRRDGMALRRAAVGIGLGIVFGYGTDRVPSYVREAVGSYHLMRQRLLALYDGSHSGLYPHLARSV